MSKRNDDQPVEKKRRGPYGKEYSVENDSRNLDIFDFDTVDQVKIASDEDVSAVNVSSIIDNDTPSLCSSILVSLISVYYFVFYWNIVPFFQMWVINIKYCVVEHFFLL